MTLPLSLSRVVPKPPNNYFQAWKAELHPQKLIPSLIAGVVTGTIGIIRAISYAALIFSGGLAPHLDVGIGLAVFSTAVISIIVALTSSMPGMIATPLAAPTAVLAILAANLASSLAPTASAEEVVLTVVTAIALGSIATGLVLFLLGRFKLGNAIQFVPYPVVGGFMAGTGLLLVRGAFHVMTGEELGLSNLTALFGPEQFGLWFVGLLVAVGLLLATKRWQHFSVMPVSILVAIALFYTGLLATDTTPSAARADGWLLDLAANGDLWRPLNWTDFGSVHWGAIASQAGTIGLLVFVSLVSLVMTNNGIEQVLGRDLDLNRELQAVGLANLAAGFGSSMAGNQALPSTLLVKRMGAANRLAGVFKTIPCVAVLGLGASFLTYFPRPILGSLLLYIGIDLLIRWLYQVRSSLPFMDYLIIPAVMLAINAVGFLPGIALGFGLAVLAFLYRYSKVGAIASEQLCCDGRICVLGLQSFLFFGSIYPLQQRVRERLSAIETCKDAPRYIVCDFSAVCGLDSSAVQAFKRLLDLAQKQGAQIAFTNLQPAFEAQLRLGGGLTEAVFPDVDACLESWTGSDPLPITAEAISDSAARVAA